MTKEKYLNMQDKLGKEPDLTKMPPDIDDFPYDVQMAIQVYNRLGDRFTADYGYLGKDYTNLNLFIDIYGIDNKEIFVEALLRMDERVIKSIQEKLKQERAKLNKKR